MPVATVTANFSCAFVESHHMAKKLGVNPKGAERQGYDLPKLVKWYTPARKR